MFSRACSGAEVLFVGFSGIWILIVGRPGVSSVLFCADAWVSSSIGPEGLVVVVCSAAFPLDALNLMVGVRGT